MIELTVSSKIKNLLAVIGISLLPTLLVWLPFFLRIRSFWSIPLPQRGMETIVANYDGPLFLVVAKTFYNATLIKPAFEFPLPVQYYASHFPAFPILIKIFSFILGYPYAMLFVTVASSILAIYFFFKLANLYLDEKNSLWLTLVFAVFPARWLIVRSVGSAEPLFLASIIASIYFFNQKKYLWAGIWGALAQITKSPAILLFVAYSLYLITPHLKKLTVSNFKNWFNQINFKKIYPIFFIPLGLLIVFTVYAFTFKDFFAYFHSGDNIHLFFPPFQIFNYSAPWVGTFWLEEVIFVYLLGALGLVKLAKHKMGAMAWFVGIFFTSTIFVAHRDIIRYSLPIIPFLYIAFADIICKKEFRYVLAIIIIPIYLFSLAYISQNVMPISNWAPFL